MNRDLPVALFCCNRITPTLEMAYAVRAMAASRQLRPVVILGSELLRGQLPNGLFGDAEVIVLTQVLRRAPLVVDIPRGWGAMSRAFRLMGLDACADYCLVSRNLAQGNIVFERLARRLRIGMVLVTDDRSLGSEFGVVVAARKVGIPTVAVPFALSDPDADAINRSERANFSLDRGGVFSRYLKCRIMASHPENIRPSKGQRLLFLTAGQVLAMVHHQARFSVPWAYGGGGTDVACVYGSAIRDTQVQLGVAADKLIVTGQCSMDDLYRHHQNREHTRQALIDVGELTGGRPVIVCAMPQFVEHGMLNSNDHSDVTNRLVAGLAATGADVLLSLHPRARIENYRNAAERHKVMITSRRLIDVLSVADVFVAAASSTLRWAVLLGIPTIVLDYFDAGPGGVFPTDLFTMINEPTALRDAAAAMIWRADMRAEKITKMRAFSAGLDPFDGHNSERLRATLESLLNQPVSSAIRGARASTTYVSQEIAS